MQIMKFIDLIINQSGYVIEKFCRKFSVIDLLDEVKLESSNY